MSDEVQVSPPLIDHTCSGPNHGLDALPQGLRIWQPGVVVSLTQKHDDMITYNVFCSPECLCDWHGWFAASLQNQPDPNAHIPGRFTLIWVSPDITTFGRYEDWDALTEQIATYQLRRLEHEEAQEGQGDTP